MPADTGHQRRGRESRRSPAACKIGQLEGCNHVHEAQELRDERTQRSWECPVATVTGNRVRNFTKKQCAADYNCNSFEYRLEQPKGKKYCQPQQREQSHTPHSLYKKQEVFITFTKLSQSGILSTSYKTSNPDARSIARATRITRPISNASRTTRRTIAINHQHRCMVRAKSTARVNQCWVICQRIRHRGNCPCAKPTVRATRIARADSSAIALEVDCISLLDAVARVPYRAHTLPNRRRPRTWLKHTKPRKWKNARMNGQFSRSAKERPKYLFR